MGIENILEKINDEIDEKCYNPAAYGITDNTLMIEFALNFLLSNLDDAFVDTVWCSEHNCHLKDCPKEQKHQPNRDYYWCNKCKTNHMNWWTK